MLNRDKFFIGGQWRAPSGRDTIDVHNAGTGEVMGRVPAGDEKDVHAAVTAARGAFESWSAKPPAERAQTLEKISAGLKARADELAKLIAQEVGMPLKMASRIQVGLPIANFANYAKIVGGFSFESRVGNSVVVREPVGVVGAITPWNYPLHQITLKVAAALGAGCTVVLKPSEVAPFNAFVLAEVIEQAGLPKGAFNLVTGYGPSAGEASLGRHDLLHRLDARRQAHLGARRAGRQARRAGARRQERLGDPRGCRPAGGG
jgi:aldehyde dehydrogenase (NAD+)